MLGEVCQPDTQELFHKFLMSQNDMSKAGNRRKQSKPNRLQAEEQANLKNALSTAALAVQSQEVDISKQEEIDMTSAMDLSSRPSSAQMNSNEPESQTNQTNGVETVSFPCHSCSEVFTSRSEQERHLADKHSSDKNENSPQTFPTAYHKLASDLSLQPAAVAQMLAGGRLDQNLSIPNKAGGPVPGGKGAAGTVFQREAYCEICQREFCNKYFLKTHKANIHGIVDPNDSKFSPNTVQKTQQIKKEVEMAKQNAISTTTKAGDNMEDFCEICQKHFCNKYYLKKHRLDVHNIRPDGSKSSQPGHNENNERAMLPPTSGGMPMMMMPPSLSSSQQMNNMLFVNPFVPNMAAMGMVPPGLMHHPLFMQNPLSGLSGLPGFPNNLLPPMKDADEKPEKLSPSSPKESVTSEPDAEPSFCNLCKKEFCNTYFLKVHKANRHGIFDESDNQSKIRSSSPGTSPGQTLNPVVVSSTADNRKIEPAFSVHGSGLPQSLSFDAMLAAKQADRIVCDICNKEVCNKYFLKAHKLKMHGISSDRSLNQSMEENSRDNLSVLSKHDMPNNRTPPYDQATSPGSSIQAGSESENFCQICKRDYGNPVSLRAHLMKSHGVKLEPNGEASDLSMNFNPNLTNEALQWKMKEQAALNSLNASPVRGEKYTWRWKENSSSMRVFCDICNKELCNKYFLKTHKKKLHGISDDGSPTPTKADSSVNNAMMASTMMADLARVTQAHLKSGYPELQGFHFDKMKSPYSQPSGSPDSADMMEGLREDTCHLCGMTFEKISQVQEHIRNDHKLDITNMFCNAVDDIRYKCKNCLFQTPVLSSIYVHESKYHDASLSTCRICSDKFSSIEKLTEHTYKLHRLPLSVRTLQRIQSQKKHSKSRKVKCPKCSKRFFSKQLCKSHLRSVHNVKLRAKASLGSHQKVYACDKCTFTSDALQKLRSHQLQKHHYTSNGQSNGRVADSRGSPSSARSNEITLQQFEVVGFDPAVLAMSRITLPVFSPVKDQMSVTLMPKSA